MSLKNLILIGGGALFMGHGIHEMELMHVRRQEYISEYLDTQDRLTPKTMTNAEHYAADRNAFYGLTAALSFAAGVGAMATGSVGRDEEN